MDNAQTGRIEDRTSLRRRTGYLLGDCEVWKATQDGDTTTFIDENHIIYADYTGQLVYFATGQNAGSQRKIINTIIADAKVEWARPLPFITAEHDEAELWNKNGQTWSVDDANNAVVEAHRRALEHFPIPLVMNSSFSGQFIEIPEEFWGVTAIEWQSSDGTWNRFDRATRSGGPGYWVVRGERIAEVKGVWSRGYESNSIRIRGYLREAPLLFDASTTQMNTEWIVIEAARILLQAAKGRFAGDREIESRYRDFESETSAKRILARGRREPIIDLVM